MQTKSADRTPMLRTARTLAFAFMLPALAMTTAHAESTADAQANYQKQKADCMRGQTAEGKKTCLREAAAALNDAKNGRLDKGKFNSNFEANATARCQAFKNADDRDLCERRQREGTTTGSVGGGGDIRELTVTVPAEPASQNGMPQSQPQ